MGNDTAPDIAVTGATGGIGGAVARRLAAAGTPTRLVVRDPARAPDLPNASVAVATYADTGAMTAALAGCRTLLLVSAGEDADRVPLHTGVVDAAAAAGVERVVYTSFVNAGPESTFTFARDHWHTEQHIRASGLRFTFLRDGLYQDILPTFAAADGTIAGPAGDGSFAPVARDDVAEVAARVLIGDAEHDGRCYDLTGPERTTMHGVAAVLAAVSGRPVRYQPQTMEEAFASRAHYGAPEWEVTGWVTTYAAVATGELDLVTDTVAELTGRPATTFADYLAAHPGAYRHLFGAGG